MTSESACRARLVLAIHNHQPIGNFDGVFAEALRESYFPFLETLRDFPAISIVLHLSGSLYDWLAANQPRYLELVAELLERGQIELIGGPYYEAILASIPRQDRIGQILLYRNELERRFGARIRGAWMPERVWEQSFAADLAQAGIEYTLLDDGLFVQAGVTSEDIQGYYVTEDGGDAVKVFAISEQLRYRIPYASPQEIVDYCGSYAGRFQNPVLVFGDDGEKFGVWPGTKEHVYGKGWLRSFFQTLTDNAHWLKVGTLANAVDFVSPRGRIYLPDGSYREMTEWALPTERQRQYRRMVEQQSVRHDWHEVRPFVRAGNWRNFLVKYPEAQEMHARMLQVSRRLQQIDRATLTPCQQKDFDIAQRSLYRAQCNCSYWHGAFGGLYLPHLRNGVYRELIGADSKIESLAGRPASWVEIEAADFNLDARTEVRLAGNRLVAFVAPARGGCLYELDVREIATNLLATLDRREEPYHQTIRQHAGQPVSGQGGGVDPAGGVRFKQADLDRKLQHDRWQRKSLVDHVLRPGLTRAAFAQGDGHVGDFTSAPYQSLIRRNQDRVETRLWRDGRMGPYNIAIAKTISLCRENGSQLFIRYELDKLPAGLPIHFAVEFNFAAMAGGADNRYFYDERGSSLGRLDAELELAKTMRIGLTDEWLGLDVALDFNQPAQIWTMPIQTVSQSESGFELVHQSCAVVPHWEFLAPSNGRWEAEITMSLDLSAHSARRLAEIKPPHSLRQRDRTAVSDDSI